MTGNMVGAVMNHSHHVLNAPEEAGRFWSIVPVESP